MKIRCRKVLLLPLALGLLTTSCNDDSTKGSSKVEVAPKPQIPKATPQERAAKLGTVAMIPAGISSVVSLYDLDGIVRDARATHVGNSISAMFGGAPDREMDAAESADTKVDPNALMAGEGKDVTVSKDESQPALPEGVAEASIPVKDVVIALGSEYPQFMEAVAPIYAAIMSMQNTAGLMALGADLLKNDAEQAKINKEAKEYMEKTLCGSLSKLVGALDLSPGKGTAPFMAIATLSPEAKAQVEASIAQMSAMSAMLSQGMLAPHSVKAAGLDFTGVVIDGKTCANSLNQLIASQKDEAMKMAYSQMKDKLQSCKLYVLVAFKGNQLINVICTNPEQQIRLAATPAESVLAQDDFSFIDGHLKDQLAGVAYVSPAMQKSLVSVGFLASNASYNGYAEAVRQLGGSFGTKPEVVDSICSGITQFTSLYSKLAQMSNTSKPMTAVAWRKEGLKVAVTSGAGSELAWNQAGTLSGVNPQALPGSALTGFCSLSPELTQLYYSMMGQAGETAWKAATVIMESPNADVSVKNRMIYAQVKALAPEISKIWEATQLGLSATTGSSAVAIKLDGDMPPCASSEYRGAKVPRIATVKQLKDRKKLDEAWAMFKQAVDAAASKQGMPTPFASKMLVAKQEGNSSWYEIPGITGTGNFQPTATVDNSFMVLGTAKDWNQSVFKVAATPVSGNADVMGIYVNVPAWTSFIGDWVKLSQGKEGEEVITILNALSRDLESINYSVSKEGDLMIQHIDFKATR